MRVRDSALRMKTEQGPDPHPCLNSRETHTVSEMPSVFPAAPNPHTCPCVHDLALSRTRCGPNRDSEGFCCPPGTLPASKGHKAGDSQGSGSCRVFLTSLCTKQVLTSICHVNKPDNGVSRAALLYAKQQESCSTHHRGRFMLNGGQAEGNPWRTRGHKRRPSSLLSILISTNQHNYHPQGERNWYTHLSPFSVKKRTKCPLLMCQGPSADGMLSGPGG